MVRVNRWRCFWRLWVHISSISQQVVGKRLCLDICVGFFFLQALLCIIVLRSGEGNIVSVGVEVIRSWQLYSVLEYIFYYILRRKKGSSHFRYCTFNINTAKPVLKHREVSTGGARLTRDTAPGVRNQIKGT